MKCERRYCYEESIGARKKKYAKKRKTNKNFEVIEFLKGEKKISETDDHDIMRVSE